MHAILQQSVFMEIRSLSQRNWIPRSATSGWCGPHMQRCAWYRVAGQDQALTEMCIFQVESRMGFQFESMGFSPGFCVNLWAS